MGVLLISEGSFVCEAAPIFRMLFIFPLCVSSQPVNADSRAPVQLFAKRGYRNILMISV